MELGYNLQKRYTFPTCEPISNSLTFQIQIFKICLYFRSKYIIILINLKISNINSFIQPLRYELQQTPIFYYMLIFFYFFNKFNWHNTFLIGYEILNIDESNDGQRYQTEKKGIFEFDGTSSGF